MSLKEGRDKADTDDLRKGLDKSYKKSAAKLQKQNKAYKEFCERNGLKTRAERTQIARWDREQAKQAHTAANQHHKAWLKSIGAEETSLKTLDKYLDAKYNNTEEYGLLSGYNSAVKKGDISPFVGFDQYLTTAAAIEDKLVGITTANGVKIKDFATHFIDRVIGQVSEDHVGKRCGVKIDEVMEALLSPESISDVYERKGDRRQNFVGKTAKVSISVTDSRLIQTNPKRRNRNGKNE